MGYRGKVVEQEAARELRAQGMTLADIASELGVAKGSVSVWVRDVPFTPSKRRYGPRLRPNKLQQRKLDEIAAAGEWGRGMVGTPSSREFLIAGTALYAGEGAKTDGSVRFVNSDPRLVAFFCRWFRSVFDVDESRLRVRIYLHETLDLEAATSFWERVTGIPRSQHYEAYRAEPRESRGFTKHEFGCATVLYSCSRTHREVMGLVNALLTCDPHNPG